MSCPFRLHSGCREDSEVSKLLQCLPSFLHCTRWGDLSGKGREGGLQLFQFEFPVRAEVGSWEGGGAPGRPARSPPLHHSTVLTTSEGPGHLNLISTWLLYLENLSVTSCKSSDNVARKNCQAAFCLRRGGCWEWRSKWPSGERTASQ